MMIFILLVLFPFFRNITILVLGLNGKGKTALLQKLANGLSQVIIINNIIYFLRPGTDRIIAANGFYSNPVIQSLVFSRFQLLP